MTKSVINDRKKQSQLEERQKRLDGKLARERRERVMMPNGEKSMAFPLKRREPQKSETKDNC